MLKDFLTVAAGWIVGIVVVLSGLFVVSAQEDDLWFNCHLSGDMKCGQTAVWHGFVNLTNN